MNKLKNLIVKYPFLKIIVNRYILVLIFFLIWMLFLDNYSYLEHRVLNQEIDEIEDNIDYYKSEIKKMGGIGNIINSESKLKMANVAYHFKGN
jgi:hypothetical protein